MMMLSAHAHAPSDAQDPQVRLSEYLQILDHYRYHEDKPPYSDLSRSNKRDRDRDSDRELKLLDVIALCLTTGESHDVVATTFDKGGTLTILLSKNHAPSATDREQASLFFNALLGLNNTRDIDLIAVIATYSGMNMNKRVKKVAESLGNVRLHISTLMDGYNAGPRENEFHSQDPVLSFELDVHKSLQYCLDQLRGFVTNFDINSGDRPDTLEKFVAASQAAYFLTKTRFIRTEAENPAFPFSFKMFQRRLAKLAQYSRGIERLFVYRNRLSGRLPTFRWIDFPRDEPSPVKIAESPLDVASRVFRITSASPEYQNFFWERYPTPTGGWRRTVTPAYHAEMRLILALDSSQELLESVRPIGCSKRSCLCCWYWIRFYNFIHDTNWMAAGTHGKPYMNWRLSGDTSVDLKVVRTVRSRVEDTLDWWVGQTKRPSDEHARSSESSPDSERRVVQKSALAARYARSPPT